MGYRDTLADVTEARIPPRWEEPAPPAADMPAQGAVTTAPAQPARRAWPRRAAPWVGIAVLVAAAGAWQLGAARNTAPPPVTAMAEIGTIEDIVSATGTVQPLEFVDVGTQVTGQLRALHVAIGSTVRKGQLVAEIDASVFESKVATGRALQRSLEAQLRERQAQARLAELVFDRNRQLKRADAVSDEVLQQSEAAAQQARAQVDSLRAQIEQAQSALKGDEANLRYTRIYAPMGGTVVAINVREGQTLVASQQAPVLLRIADLQTMTVWAQVSEADVPRVATGMPVTFNTLGLPDRRWSGRVRQVLPTPETVNNVVLYNVLFDVANADGALKPQMSTQVFFRTAGVDDALTIPATALHSIAPAAKKAAKGAKGNGAADHAPRDGKAYVVRVLRDGRIEDRPVKIGLQTRMRAQVIEGLQPGEAVVIDAATGAAKTHGSGKRASVKD